MQVNPTSSLAHLLKFWPVVQSNKVVTDLISGVEGTLNSGSLTDKYTVEGYSVASSSGTSLLFDIDHEISNGPFTMVIRYRCDSNPDFWHTAISLPNNSSYGIYLPRGWYDFYMACDTTVSSTRFWTTAIVTAGKFDTFSVSSTQALTAPVGYKNGIYHPLTNDPVSIDYETGTKEVELFNGQGTEYAIGTIAWAAVWNRFLTDTEQYELHRDPMQMFTERSTVMWYPAASIAIARYNYGAYWM